MNQDDHFNYHDRTQIAQTRGPRTVEVVNNRGVAYTLFRVGTLIALRHEDFSDAGWTGRIVKIDGEHITFDRDLPPQKGMLFVLLDKGYATENFLFKDCWFHDSPWNRGIVQGNNVTLDGCRFGPMIGTPLKFISCYTYTCWCEGIGCSNVVVRNCRFENCLSSRYENNPQIIVSMQTPPEHWPQKHERITHEAFARQVAANTAAGRTVKPCRNAVSGLSDDEHHAGFGLAEVADCVLARVAADLRRRQLAVVEADGVDAVADGRGVAAGHWPARAHDHHSVG